MPTGRKPMEKGNKKFAAGVANKRFGRGGEAMEDLWRYEKEALDAGYQSVCGCDEAGAGPLAGPGLRDHGAAVPPRDVLADGEAPPQAVGARAPRGLVKAAGDQ